MKHVVRILVLAMIGLFLFNPAASSFAQSQPAVQFDQNVRFERISVEDGLPHATVLSALQDQDGFMWFATADGLARFDGIHFTVFRKQAGQNSLSNNNTFSLIQTRDGLIWIGTDPGGLNVYDPQTGQFSLFLHDPDDPQSIADNSIWSLLEDREGNVWAGTRNGLSRLDRETGKFTNYHMDSENPRALAGAVIYRLYQDSQGTIWVGTRGGLQRYEPATDDFTTFVNDPEDAHSISSNVVWAMLEDSEGTFWVGTAGGLNRMDRGTNRFEAFPFDQNLPATGDRVWSIFEDQYGNLWVATESRGLNLFDRKTGKFTAFRHNASDPLSLNNDDVFWMTEDRSGVLWITSRYGGVNKLSPMLQRFGLYRSIPGDPRSLSSNSVYSMFAEEDGTLWVGTFGGGLNRIDRNTGKVTVYQHDPEDPFSLSNNKIYYIFKDSKGVLWFCTSGGGLNRMNPRAEIFYAFKNTADQPDVLVTNFLTVIDEADNNRLWVGTLGYGLILFDPQTGKTDKLYDSQADDPNSLSEGTIYDLEVDRDGGVWIATARGGLEWLDPETGIFTHHRNDPEDPNNSILSDTVHALYLDEEAGFIWAGTSEGLSGLNLVNGEWHNYTTNEGLPNSTIMGIQPGRPQELWISTGKGISRFDIPAGNFTNFDVRDGLQGDQFQLAASRRGPDGEIFFGGSAGLTFFYPDQILKNAYVPEVVFTDFQLFNQSVPAGSDLLPFPIEKTNKITLNYDQSVFTIKYSALNYQISSKNMFQYKMDGFDNDWSPARTTNEATYTNLSPGKYTFMVRAANNDGVWNEEPTSIDIDVLPPWWQTWWFRIGAVLIVAALAGGLIRARFHSIQAINKELEVRVDERTRELSDAQLRLQDANTELKTQLAEILALEQKLREQAVRDPLTGLYNRHILSEVLPAEISRASRGGYMVAFMLMDLDHFKRVNDEHGHVAGDRALIEVAKAIIEHTRRSDIACRYGGEEFLVILPEITVEDALQRAENLRVKIGNLSADSESETLNLTASIGMAMFPLHGENIDQILLEADRALYSAKHSGRNRVALPG